MPSVNVGSGETYTTLQAWFDTVKGASPDTYVVTLTSDITDDFNTTGAVAGAWDITIQSDATRRTITCPGGGNHTILCADTDVGTLTLQDLNVNGNNVASKNCIKVNSVTTLNVKRCILYNAHGDGVENTQAGTVNLENTLIYDCDHGIASFSTGTVTAKNCTVIDNSGYGLNAGALAGTLNAYNCVSMNNSSGDVRTENTIPTINIISCVTSDTTGTHANLDTTTNTVISKSTYTSYFTDYANDDFSLQDSASNLWSVTADAGNTPADDIEGTTRTNDDAGAYESAAASAPEITVTPTSQAFSCAVDATDDEVINIANDGTADLTVSAITIAGTYYSLVSPPSTPLVIGASTSQNVTVRWSPTAAGATGGTLTIASDDADEASVVVTLTGSTPVEAAGSTLLWMKGENAYETTLWDNATVPPATYVRTSGVTFASGSGLPYSFLNQVGYSETDPFDPDTGGFIPRSEVNTSTDSAGNTLQYSGVAPRNAKLVESNCLSFDGTNDVLTIGDVGTPNYCRLWVKLAIDNQEILTFASTAATAVTVSGGSLTFGSLTTPTEIFIDQNYANNLTAAEAGAILNDNEWHYLEFDLISVTANNLKVGFDGSTGYGQVLVCGLQLGDNDYLWPMAEGSGNDIYNAIMDQDHGTNSGASWSTQDNYHFNVVNGFTESAGVLIPRRLGTSLNAAGGALDNEGGNALYENVETAIDFRGNDANAPWVATLDDGEGGYISLPTSYNYGDALPTGMGKVEATGCEKKFYAGDEPSIPAGGRGVRITIDTGL